MCRSGPQKYIFDANIRAFSESACRQAPLKRKLPRFLLGKQGNPLIPDASSVLFHEGDPAVEVGFIPILDRPELMVELGAPGPRLLSVEKLLFLIGIKDAPDG